MALKTDTNIIIMLNPDYQYTPKLVQIMCSLVAEGVYDMVLGSRILIGGELRGGMPLYKYMSNRIITLIENLFLSAILSEYHTCYRVYHLKVLESISYSAFSNNFIFDNKFLTEVIVRGVKIGEVSCSTKYFPEASSINFQRSLRYRILCFWYSFIVGLEFLPKPSLTSKRQ